MTRFEAAGCASDMEVAIIATKEFLNALYLIGEGVRDEQTQRAIMNLTLVAILTLQSVEQQREALVRYLEGVPAGAGACEAQEAPACDTREIARTQRFKLLLP